MYITYEMVEHVAVLRLDDERRRNALSTTMVRDGLAALERSRLHGARAIVIGSAQRWFCAGADVRDMVETGWLERTVADPSAPTPPDLFAALANDSRPVIAAVDGLALGGGVELAVSCDLVVAGAGATFAFPELALGVIPNTALARLPAIVGARMAKDLILTRRRLDATQAHALGIVSRLVPDGEATREAITLATEIVESCPPAAIAAAKRALDTTADWQSVRALLANIDKAEWSEGINAFIEKRKPGYGAIWDAAGKREADDANTDS